MKKVAINGFGRIGRLVFRLLNEDSNFEVVAINDLTDAAQLAHLLKFDSNHGNYKVNEISYDDSNIIVGNKKIKVFSEKEPSLLPWKDLEIDQVFECSGHFTQKELAYKHIEAGAKKVIISAPAKGDVKTIVYGVNESILDGTEEVISAASCTTNCLAPIVNLLDQEFKIVKGYMTTIHAYTNDQPNLDVAHKKDIYSRRGRAAAINIIPTSTGAAKAIDSVLPSLKGKLDGSAIRVPVSDGSMIELILELEKNTSTLEINEIFKNNQSDAMAYTELPLVSSDIIGNTNGGVVDGLLTSILEVNGKQLVKVIAWYDNEMGYSCQMVRTAKYLGNLK